MRLSEYPRFSTIQYPNEYNIKKEIEDIIHISNTKQKMYVKIDIGKLVGLYLSYLVLKENKNII